MSIDFFSFLPSITNWIVMILILYIAYRMFESMIKRIFRELIREEVVRMDNKMRELNAVRNLKQL